MSLPPFSESEAKVKPCHKLLVDLVWFNIRIPLTGHWHDHFSLKRQKRQPCV